MKFRRSIRTKLFFSHLLAILLVSGSVGTIFYLSAAESLVKGISSLIASILLSLFFGWWLARRITDPIRVFIDRCHAIAKGRLDERITIRTHDEMDQLVSAFNDMQQALSASEREKRQAYEDLLKARDELEIRVEQRTSDIREVNKKLNQEIAVRLRVEKVVEDAARTDSLTGLPNRRIMNEYLEQEAIRSRRSKAPLTVLMLDLDSFKRVNDEHGRDAGDVVLVETAKRMRALIRGQDLLARWGGEEFVILLPETPLAGGGMVAEKIRTRITGELYLLPGRQIALTISIGVASLAQGQEPEALLKAADAALHRAKRLGRNRVETAANPL